MTSILIKKTGVFPEGKAPYEKYAVSLDITTWLGIDKISNVTFTAKDEDGEDATSDVLDTNKSTFTSYIIYPYVKGGVNGIIYTAYLSVETENGDFGEFYLQFTCLNPN